MNRLALTSLAVVAAMFQLTAHAIDPSEALEDPSQQALYEQITSEVRCLVC